MSFGRNGLSTSGSQVDDYAMRGVELEEFPLIFFISETYEEKFKASDDTGQQDEADPADVGVEDEVGEDHVDSQEVNVGRKRGRKPNERSRYLPDHPRYTSHTRVVRSAGHNTIPSTRGPFYPPHNEPETIDFFRASMLAICKPWRRLDDLRREDQTWEQAYEDFFSAAPKRSTDIVAGIKSHYDSRTAASLSREDENNAEVEGEGRRRRRNELDELAEAEQVEERDPLNVAEPEADRLEAIRLAIDKCANSQEEVHGKAAVEIAKTAGIFTSEGEEWETAGQDAGVATGDDLAKLVGWQHKLKEIAAAQGNAASQVTDTDEGAIQLGTGGAEYVQYVSPETIDIGEEALSGVDPSCLFEDQRRAFDIVDYHLRQTLDGKKPPQLLMHIAGEGGTGKSRVIQTITDQFKALGCEKALVKAAYTGIAASLIGGSTLHVVCRIPPPSKYKGGRIVHSAEKERELAEFYTPIKYLIIDEISMVPREFLAQISRIISKARAHLEDHSSNAPFGGLNVIILGDMHQFPPVQGGASHALFTAIRNEDLGDKNKEDFVAGRQIYEQFDTVVKLRKQVRVVDQEWKDFLGRARHGSCKSPDLRMLRSLLITSRESQRIDFSQEPWSNAVLVTPRHAVRRQWNSLAVRRHCRLNGVTLYISKAYDVTGGRLLTAEEDLQMMKKREVALATELQIAIGMKVMITFNVNTEKDIANGARGKVVDIILDPRETVSEGSTVHLKYPPAYVLVKLDRSNGVHLDGLPEGVVPIAPIKKQFYILVGGKRKKVTRLQLPMTPAYAFTDYRSQGQTIEYVIVDIGRPPRGALTGFNAYVALSRSSGRSTIRLLRDFEDKLFTQHPSEDLRKEDRRIEELDYQTRITWQAIFQNMHNTL